MNESIAMCGLRYRSTNVYTEYCYVPILAWIVLPDRPTATTTDEPNTNTESSTSEDTPTTNEPVIRAQESIPDEVSISFIVIAGLCIAIVLSMIACIIWFLYKKFGKSRKRKNSSVLPLLEDGSTAIQAHGEDGPGHTVRQAHHGGVLNYVDIDSEENVTFRASAQN